MTFRQALALILMLLFAEGANDAMNRYADLPFWIWIATRLFISVTSIAFMWLVWRLIVGRPT